MLGPKGMDVFQAPGTSLSSCHPKSIVVLAPLEAMSTIGRTVYGGRRWHNFLSLDFMTGDKYPSIPIG